MPKRRAPWWMYVVAASFLGLFAFLPYLLITGPADTAGLNVHFTGSATEIRAVAPGSQADKAGLRAGDIVTAIDGQAVPSSQVWQAIKANLQVGQVQHWQILRDGRKLVLEMPTLKEGPGSPQFYSIIFYNIGVGFCFLVLGLIIAFRRPHDSLARIGAWFLLTAGIAFGVGNGWAALWRQLPWVIQILLWIPELSRFVVEGIFLTFVVVFPRRLFRSRWPWVLIWAPVLATLPWRFYGMYSLIYRPGHAASAPLWLFQVILLRRVIYLLAGVVVLVVNYRRLEDRNEKRRMRVVVAGIGLSLFSALTVVLYTQEQGFAMSKRFPVLYFALPLYAAFPASLAYAILRHRLFDLGVMIRQGLQYALVRGVVLSLVPVLGAILVGDLLLHGNQPLINILAARGWVYAALGGLALVAHTQRTRWMQALDRRFFREHYDAQRLLREIVEEIRQGGLLERIAPRTVDSIESALHPEFASLMVMAPGEKSYKSLAVAPAGQAPPPLAADSKLAALVRVLGKPLETPHSESGWLQQQLPHEETDFLRRARIDLLVPVTTAPTGAEALLALGVKRSEEPYSREDQDLLQAIAASLALLMGKPPSAPAAAPGDVFEECPTCGTCYDSGSSMCSRDNSGLTVTQLPRVLAGRYRLERRRGRGGMGTVYEAVDRELERRVAVKVIREELVGNAEAAERFRREARAAASFAHPNVVTIFDFGVEAENRAYLVMELLEGVSARDELKRLGRLPAGRVLAVLRGTCAAVEAAHHRQLVHRDLKPENIFLARSEAGEVAKVLDFGIAKFLPGGEQPTADQPTADTATGALIGTVRYMSPEQLRGGKVDKTWDVWALAVVTYEMLAGAHPFEAGTAAEYHSAILAGRVTAVSTYLPDAPPAWQEFFSRALALDASARPASAAEFCGALERALA